MTDFAEKLRLIQKLGLLSRQVVLAFGREVCRVGSQLTEALAA